MRAVLASIVALLGFIALAGCGGPAAELPKGPPTEAPKAGIGVSGGPTIPEPPK